LKLLQELELRLSQAEIELAEKWGLSDEAEIRSRAVGDKLWNVIGKIRLTAQPLKPVSFILDQGIDSLSCSNFHDEHGP
jgi:hypothetical protein